MQDAQIWLVSSVTAGGVEVYAEKHAPASSFYLDADGFLTLKVTNVSEESWSRFLAAHGGDGFIDLLGDGSGSKIMDGDEVVGLEWKEGCDLVVLVTELETVEIPPNPGFGDRSA